MRWQQNQDNPKFAQRYAWLYLEGVNDLYITDHAVQVPEIILIRGVGVLPDLLHEEMCASSEEEVWSLNSVISDSYFRFPEEMWP